MLDRMFRVVRDRDLFARHTRSRRHRQHRRRGPWFEGAFEQRDVPSSRSPDLGTLSIEKGDPEDRMALNQMIVQAVSNPDFLPELNRIAICLLVTVVVGFLGCDRAVAPRSRPSSPSEVLPGRKAIESSSNGPEARSRAQGDPASPEPSVAGVPLGTWVERLNDLDRGTRDEALRHLESAVSNERPDVVRRLLPSVPNLESLLKNRDADVRTSAASLLLKLDPARHLHSALPVLIGRLEKDHKARTVVAALAKREPTFHRGVADALAEAVRGNPPGVRRAATVLLESLDSELFKRVVRSQALVDLKSGSPAAKFEAIGILRNAADRTDKEVADALIASKRDQNKNVSRVADEALEAILDADAYRLVAMNWCLTELKETLPERRKRAIRGLRNLHAEGESVFRAVIDVRENDRDREVRMEAEGALQDLPGAWRFYIAAALTRLEAKAPEDRLDALEILRERAQGYRTGEELKKKVGDALFRTAKQDRDLKVRQKATAVVAGLVPEANYRAAAIELVAADLKDPNPKKRKAALGSISDPEHQWYDARAIELVSSTLQDGDVDVRIQAAQTLAAANVNLKVYNRSKPNASAVRKMVVAALHKARMDESPVVRNVANSGLFSDDR